MVDALPDFAPTMLRGLRWSQALNALRAVDCAVRRDHWCSPVVVLIDGQSWQDDDGDLTPFVFMDGDRRSADWSMTPRMDADGNEVPPTYRSASNAAQVSK